MDVWNSSCIWELLRFFHSCFSVLTGLLVTGAYSFCAQQSLGSCLLITADNRCDSSASCRKSSAPLCTVGHLLQALCKDRCTSVSWHRHGTDAALTVNAVILYISKPREHLGICTRAHETNEWFLCLNAFCHTDHITQQDGCQQDFTLQLILIIIMSK